MKPVSLGLSPMPKNTACGGAKWHIRQLWSHACMLGRVLALLTLQGGAHEERAGGGGGARVHPGQDCAAGGQHQHAQGLLLAVPGGASERRHTFRVTAARERWAVLSSLSMRSCCGPCGIKERRAYCILGFVHAFCMFGL